MDLASGPWSGSGCPGPRTTDPTSSPFDVVEAPLADEPERDDLAQPEAVTAVGLPRHLGTLHGRRVRRALRRLVAPVEDHVLGLPRGDRPLLGVPGLPPVAGPGRPGQGPRPLPAHRRPLGLGPLRLGSQRQLAPGGGSPAVTGPSTSPGVTGCPARTWPPPSGSSPTTWWPPCPCPATATATRRSGPCCPRLTGGDLRPAVCCLQSCT